MSTTVAIIVFLSCIIGLLLVLGDMGWLGTNLNRAHFGRSQSFEERWKRLDEEDQRIQRQIEVLEANEPVTPRPGGLSGRSRVGSPIKIPSKLTIAALRDAIRKP